MPLFSPALFSGNQRYTPRAQYPSLGDAGFQVAPDIGRPSQPQSQMTYQDVNAGGGFSPGNSGGPTRDWQAISDSETSYRSEPFDVTPGRSATISMTGPMAMTRPKTQTKEYTHMDLSPHPQVAVPSVAVRNSNFNPSEAGVDNRRGVWRMPVGGQSFLGGMSPSTQNALEIGGVIVGVLILVGGLAMWRNRRG